MPSNDMTATRCFNDLTIALGELDKTRARLESLRDWARTEAARVNTRDARALLERTVPEHLRETVPATETTAAGRCFRQVSSILNRQIQAPK